MKSQLRPLVCIGALLVWTGSSLVSRAQTQALDEQYAKLSAAIQSFNAQCGQVRRDSKLDAWCRQEKARLQAEQARYEAARNAYDQSQLATPPQASASSATSVVEQEQDEFDKANAAWLAKQEQLVRQAVESDKKWRDEVLLSIQQIRVPESAHRPKTLDDILPGDILLLGPAPDWSATIPRLDQFYRIVRGFAEGEYFRQTPVAPVSHAITFVKAVGGKRLFLDHTHLGSRILDDTTFSREYGGRPIYDARPEQAVDGRRLWAVAREAAINHDGYGVWSDRCVCSDKAAISVAKATGIVLPGKRLAPIDVTPGDFFDENTQGKYFLVSPLK